MQIQTFGKDGHNGNRQRVYAPAQREKHASWFQETLWLLCVVRGSHESIRISSPTTPCVMPSRELRSVNQRGSVHILALATLAEWPWASHSSSVYQTFLSVNEASIIYYTRLFWDPNKKIYVKMHSATGEYMFCESSLNMNLNMLYFHFELGAF